MGSASNDGAEFPRSLARANNVLSEHDFGCGEFGSEHFCPWSPAAIVGPPIVLAAIASAVLIAPVIISPVGGITASIVAAAIASAVLIARIVILPSHGVAALIGLATVAGAGFLIARVIILAVCGFVALIIVGALSLRECGSGKPHNKTGAQDTEDNFTGHFVLHHE